ncbi:MAG TPA: twin-arginine translocase subunit TatC [Thermomicrobiales bacterium]|nr:twin-arginine translocase subunit TatC [Thermomicrobiales bacterium]
MARALKVPKVPLPSIRPPKDEEPYEDVFEEMTLAEHLNELRSRIVKTCLAIGAAFVIAIFLASPMLDLVRRTADVEKFDVNEATEPITDYFKIAMYMAIAFALPVIFYQLFAFVAPGLTRKEKRLVYSSLPFVVILFLAGAAFAFFLAIPRAFAFLSSFKSDTFDYSPTAGSIFSFYLQVTLGMGIAFELPIIMYLLSRLGIVSPKRMANSRRYAAVVVLIAAAIITPTPDPFNMLFVAAPIYCLYELGLVFARVASARAGRANASG